MKNLKVKNAADQELINHVAFVLDASYSMSRLKNNVVSITDSQLSGLASSGRDYNQETRASIYQFGDEVECLFFDRDVERFSSIKNRFSIQGNTALVSATLRAIEDLQQTATIS